jgi:hypothetical protein
MKNKILAKLTRFYKLVLIGVLFYPIKFFAQAQTKYGPVPPMQELYGVQMPMYGVAPVPQPMPVLYGPTPVYAAWTLEKFLLIVVLPLGILLAIGIGLLIYLKKRAKKDVKKNH